MLLRREPRHFSINEYRCFIFYVKMKIQKCLSSPTDDRTTIHYRYTDQLESQMLFSVCGCKYSSTISKIKELPQNVSEKVRHFPPPPRLPVKNAGMESTLGFFLTRRQTKIEQMRQNC